ERVHTMLTFARGPSASTDRAETRTGNPVPIVVVTARAAMDRIMSPDACRASTWRLAVGDRVRPEHIIGQWVRAGYEPVSVVERPGEFARRGGIIDVYPCGGGAPTDPSHSGAYVPPAAFRIELWGNEIDSIRAIDPASQRSIDPVREITIGPAHEVLPEVPPQAAGEL